MQLNYPVPSLPASLEGLEAAVVEVFKDNFISTSPRTLLEAYEAVKKINAEKAPGVCGIHPEHIHYAS